MQTTTPGLLRPETDHARRFKACEPDNPRWRYNNVIHLDLDMPERSTQEYEGMGTESNVAHILDMDIDDSDQQIQIPDDDDPGNPYLRCIMVRTCHDD